MAANIPSKMDKLTPRERQIYLLVTEGKSNKYISETLGISFNTVRTHIDHIRRKLGKHGREWAVSSPQDDQKDVPTL